MSMKNIDSHNVVSLGADWKNGALGSVVLRHQTMEPIKNFLTFSRAKKMFSDRNAAAAFLTF